METYKILQADLLDIVFEGRNKSYGAYELRRSYDRRLFKAMAFTLAAGIAIAGIVTAKSSYATEVTVLPKITELTLVDAKLPEPEPLPPLPPPPARVTPPPIMETIKFTRPVLTDEAIITPPPEQEDLALTRIGTISQEGIRSADIVVPLSDVDGNRGLLATPVRQKEDPETFKIVEIQASYVGDWKRFLERNLSGEVPVDNGAAPGNYTVVIQFIVDKEGRVSEIKPLTQLGYGMEKEAMRVIRKSGKWKPAIQNGYEVKAYRKQPITFQVLSS